MPPENNNINPTVVPPVTPDSTPTPQTPATPVQPTTPPPPPVPPMVSTPEPSEIPEPVKTAPSNSGGSFLSLLLIPVLLLLGIGTALALVYFFPDVFESLGIIKEQKTENTNNDEKDPKDENIQIAQKTERINCPDWIYANKENDEQDYMDIKYEDVGNVTFENVNETCTNIEMNYKTGKLFLTYSHGEAFVANLPEDRKMTTLETRDLFGKTVGLARSTDGVNLEGNLYGGVMPAGKLYQYVELYTDPADCSATVMDPTLRYPCFLPGNHTVTPSGDFTVYIPNTTGNTEREEILKFFDYVAMHSSYNNSNEEAS